MSYSNKDLLPFCQLYNIRLITLIHIRVFVLNTNFKKKDYPKSTREGTGTCKSLEMVVSMKSSHLLLQVRTVLNEKQLHMLRTCYAANPRPDALMKEQLVEMTGLSPRVIRVWFQNKRCKDKKKQIMIKQMEQHHQARNTLKHTLSY